MPILTLNEISQEFGGLRALDGVSLQVEEQQIYGIIGPKVAAKTTLYNHITGIYDPSEGTISFRRVLTVPRFTNSQFRNSPYFQNIRLFQNYRF